MGNTWKEILTKEINSDYYCNDLAPFLKEEYGTATCYPAKENIFNAFKYTNSTSDVKVVIIGQDPYYNEGLANGLAFGINEGCEVPSSLQNIQTEITNEYKNRLSSDYEMIFDNSLISWAKQGVLLLNTIFTVRKGQASSHKNAGWEIFSKHILEHIIKDDLTNPLVFMLWGNYAKSYKAFINECVFGVGRENVMVLESSHPSGRAAHLGFLGSNHFVLCNDFLKSLGKEPIKWFEFVKREKTNEELEYDRYLERFHDITLFIPTCNELLKIIPGEGTTDKEDLDNGYVDYISYQRYSLNNVPSYLDGGDLMLNENVEDEYIDIYDSVGDILHMAYSNANIGYVTLEPLSTIQTNIVEGVCVGQ